MTSTEKYVAVEVHAFGHGMQTLFQGAAEVFSSMGIKAPDALEEQGKRWKPEEKKGEDHEDATERSGADVPADRDDGADVSAADEDNASVSGDSGRDDVAGVPANEDATAEDTTVETLKQSETEAQKKPRKKKDTATTVTQDDITKIIVQKIKADRSNNEKIGQLLKTYGASRVGDLPSSKYEAFITDLAAI